MEELKKENLVMKTLDVIFEKYINLISFFEMKAEIIHIGTSSLRNL